MADAYMPDVQVDIAFNAGYTTPAASRTWTDVSQYVELHQGIDITFGRQDERVVADANQLALTLDNSDGRFTAFRAASPYYPNVKVGRPIRVRVTPPGGSTVTRFVGFIDEWPVEWEGSDRYASATIRASSRLARLGLSATSRSVIEQEYLADRPVGYYTLGESQGATQANDSSGSSAAPLQARGEGIPVEFGSATGPGTDELSAAQFTYTNGRSLASSAAVLSAGTSSWSLEVFFSTSETAAMSIVALKDSGTTPGGVLAPEILVVGSTGTLIGRVSATYSVSAAVGAADGNTHHAAITFAGGTLTLYFDGISVGTVAVVGSPVFPAFGLGQFGGAMAHAAAYDTALSAARVSAHARAGRDGFAGERTDQRLVRILGWAGVGSAEITTEAGQQTMTYQKTTGQSYVDALRDAESTESGVLYDRPDGNVGFHSRMHRYLSTTSATLNMAAQHVESNYAPKLDRSALINDATVDNPTTGESAQVVDFASRDEYGIASVSMKCVAETYESLQQSAAWAVASYSTPRIRVPSLSVDVLAHQGLTPSAQTLLGLTIGDVLAVSNAPTQADSTSASYFVEGYTERIGSESYGLTFNLSPTYPTLNVLVLDDATRGKLDTGLLAL